MDIRESPEAPAIAFDDAIAKGVNGRRQVDRIAFRLHGGQRPVQRVEDGEIGGCPGVAGVGRKVEQDDGDPAFGKPGPPQRHQLVHPRRQHAGALDAGVHVAAVGARREDATPVAAGAGPSGVVGASAEDDGSGGAIQFGDRHHDGRLDRHQPALGSAPLLQRSQLGRMGRDIRHVELRQHLLRRMGVVIGRAADEGEAGQRHHRVDDGTAVLQEELLDRGRESRPDAKAGMTRRPRASSASITPS